MKTSGFFAMRMENPKPASHGTSKFRVLSMHEMELWAQYERYTIYIVLNRIINMYTMELWVKKSTSLSLSKNEVRILKLCSSVLYIKRSVGGENS